MVRFKIIAKCKEDVFWRDSQYSLLRRRQSSSLTPPDARKIWKKRADLMRSLTERESHRAVLRSRVRRYCKNLGLPWPVDFSLVSTELRVRFFKKIQDWILKSENAFCVPLLDISLQDLSDHGPSKEPKNPLWKSILRFHWRTMIRKILDWSV